MFTHIINNCAQLSDIFPFIQLKPLVEQQDLHIVGLGSAGRHVAEYIFNLLPQYTYTSVSCPPKKMLAHLDFETKPCEVSEAIDHLINDSSSADDVLIKDVLGAYSHYILIAGLGGHLGRELLQLSIDYLDSHGKDYTVIAIEPFEFEGKTALENAAMFKSIQAHNSEHIIYFNNNDLIPTCGAMLMDNTFQYANHSIFELLKASGRL